MGWLADTLSFSILFVTLGSKVVRCQEPGMVYGFDTVSFGLKQTTASKASRFQALSDYPSRLNHQLISRGRNVSMVSHAPSSRFLWIIPTGILAQHQSPFLSWQARMLPSSPQALSSFPVRPTSDPLTKEDLDSI